jgi:cyanophycinase
MLALVGSGEYLPEMEPVDSELINRVKGPPRVVCLPTAAGKEGHERITYWSRLGIDHFKRLGAGVEALPVIDRTSANDREYAKVIAGANFIYLSGGKPGYLYATLEGSLVWKAILSVLDGGGLLAGCSAGAMIMGEEFFGFPGWQTGFNLLPHMTIIPHYDQIPESRIKSIQMSIENDLTVLGIEGGTALIQSGEQYEVLGSGEVTVWKKTGKICYTHGSIPKGVL